MEDLVTFLNDLIKDVDITKMSLEDAVRSKKRVDDAIKFVKSSLDKARRTLADSAFTEVVKETKKQASLIYREEVTAAANQSGEYAYTQFLSPLIDVGDDESLYDIVSVGVGWSRGVSVTLRMDEVAGNIDDYAEAVQLARDSLGLKEDRDPQTASMIWRKKIYKGPRYFTTIQLRLLSSSSVAPFWSLLNYGSRNVKMASDIGGTPYPSRGAHRFVQKTEERVRKFFQETFYGAKEKFLSDERLVIDALLDAKDLLEKLQYAVDQLSSGAEFMEKIAQKIGVSANQLDASKILTAAERIKSGDIFTTQIVVGGGKRIRTKKFLELLSGYAE